MRYLRLVNGEIHYPYSLQALIKEFPNTSFPERLENINLIDYNIHSVSEVAKPSHQNYTKIVNELVPTLVNGQYYQNWLVEDAPTEYTESMIQNEIDKQWDVVRTTRNQYLLESDWTQLRDTPFTENKRGEWVQYRQALRDITTQTDPFNIVWPTKPE